MQYYLPSKGSSCTLVLQINGSQLPATALAFSLDGYLVYSVDSSTQARVLNNITLAPAQWGPKRVYNANNLYNGMMNTINIIATSAPFGAAVSCYNIDNTGTWFLPAICEFGPSNLDTCAGSPSFASLISLGFYNPPVNETMFFSSTQQPDNPINAAYTANLSRNNFLWTYQFKNDAFPVLCAKSITY